MKRLLKKNNNQSDLVEYKMSEKIWYDDLLVFITKDNFYQILPLKEMSLEEKLNVESV